MSDDRRYKQRGYKDYEDSQRGNAAFTPGMPRTRVVTSYKEIIRCDKCGAEISTQFQIGQDSRCAKCQATLHSCRTCYHFDTSARFECAQPIKKRIRTKDAANSCSFFRIRTVSVKDMGPSGSVAPSGPEDARKALEKLFKK